MRLLDITNLLTTIKTTYNVPFTYYSYPEKQAPKLPYIVYYYPSSNNMAADDRVYHHVTDLSIELYTETKDFTLETNIESVLESFNVVWDKTEDYINDEHMFMITYETEIYIDGE